MRRSLAVLLSACLAALALLAVSPPAEAAAPITGRLVNGHAGTPAPPVAGMTVELRESDGGTPGIVVDTEVTAADGSFTLDPGTSPASKFFVHALAGNYQAGWVGPSGTELWLQKDLMFAKKFVPGTALGKVRAIPAFIRGTVVNSVTGTPVGGVTVTARSQDAIKEVDGTDLTNPDGVFRIDGLTCEEDCYLKFNGSDSGYETGFRACNAKVVPTWPAACASPLGGIGRILLDRL